MSEKTSLYMIRYHHRSSLLLCCLHSCGIIKPCCFRWRPTRWAMCRKSKLGTNMTIWILKHHSPQCHSTCLVSA